MPIPKIGDVYSNTEHIGTGPGSIGAGTRMSVEAVDAQGQLSGAGMAGEPTVVLAFVEQGNVLDEDDKVRQSLVVRHFSVSFDVLAVLFKKEQV